LGRSLGGLYHAGLAAGGYCSGSILKKMCDVLYGC
jgi:hypothetical protein